MCNSASVCLCACVCLWVCAWNFDKKIDMQGADGGRRKFSGGYFKHGSHLSPHKPSNFIFQLTVWLRSDCLQLMMSAVDIEASVTTPFALCNSFRNGSTQSLLPFSVEQSKNHHAEVAIPATYLMTLQSALIGKVTSLHCQMMRVFNSPVPACLLTAQASLHCQIMRVCLQPRHHFTVK